LNEVIPAGRGRLDVAMSVALVLQTAMLHIIRTSSRPGLVALLVIFGLLLDNTWVSAHTHTPADAEAHAAFHGVTHAHHDLVVGGGGHLHHRHTGIHPIAGHPLEETEGTSAARRGTIGDDLGDLHAVRPIGFAFVGRALAPIPASRGPTLLARKLRAFLQVFRI
jgi:hypothetical protein